jgi:hypothetical protein
LQEFFGQSSSGRDLWPQRSAYLNLLISFWEKVDLKERVYSNTPRSLKELKHSIKQIVKIAVFWGVAPSQMTQNTAIFIFTAVRT